jgi:hypothetical protein
MEPVIEEDDEAENEDKDDHAVQSTRVHTISQPNGQPKPPPPVPTLGAVTPSDPTQVDHLVDEIGYIIRDWYDRLPAYLVERKYKLFDTVSKYIKALLLARQQLIARILTRYEEEELRREVVFTMNKGSIAQGLDVVVRDPSSGRLAVLDADVEDETVRMSAIKLYALQVAVSSPAWSAWEEARGGADTDSH